MADNKNALGLDDYSVVMAVYKNDRSVWFREALDSIINQTVKSNDVILVRDGKVSQKLEDVLIEYEERLGVKVIRLEEGVGAGEARNIGIRQAKHSLVAIMDADDIAVPRRFELQLAMFRDNPHLTIAGGQIAEFEVRPDTVVSYRQVPLLHEEIVAFSKRRSPFNNMCVCFVKDYILEVGGYKKSTHAEDYNLWLELLSRGRIGMNVADVLCLVRTDAAALKRRITWERTSELLKLRYKYFRTGYIGTSDLLVASVANIGLFVAPAGVVKFVYKKVLRK